LSPSCGIATVVAMSSPRAMHNAIARGGQSSGSLISWALMRTDDFLAGCAMLVLLSACGDPTCPSGYVFDRASGRCHAVDGGTDAFATEAGVEVCDPAGTDEDRDPSTLGPDLDGDGAPGVACCNRQTDGSLLCGTDCD